MPKYTANSVFIYEKVADHYLVLRNFASMIRDLKAREDSDAFPEKINWPKEPDQESKDVHLYYVRTQGRVSLKEILKKYSELQPEKRWTIARLRAAFTSVRNWNSMVFMQKAMDSGLL